MTLGLLFLLSCNAQQEHTGVVASTLSDSSALEETIDSVNDTRLDGTETSASLLVDSNQQLPTALEAHLKRNHGLWQLPILIDDDAERIPSREQGPYFVEADFNGDEQADYAVQIVKGDSSFMYAFLNIKNGQTWQEHLLEKHPLIEIKGKKRSFRFLTLAKKTNRYYNYSTQENFSLPQDGISVSIENSTATYVWENGKFKKYETGD